MTFDILRSPLRFLEEALAELPLQEALRAGEAWWLREGKAISDAVDRAGTPWLQMFDRNGTRIDGVVEEFPVERWFREAMILAIWEGTAHRQILDGLEVMERKRAHRLLFERLAPAVSPQELQQMQSRVELLLGLGPEKTGEKEAQAEAVFTSLAAFTAEALSRSHPR